MKKTILSLGILLFLFSCTGDWFQFFKKDFSYPIFLKQGEYVEKWNGEKKYIFEEKGLRFINTRTNQNSFYSFSSIKYWINEKEKRIIFRISRNLEIEFIVEDDYTIVEADYFIDGFYEGTTYIR